ncbi:MAG: hypothetical protein EA401_07075 [Planctomycetota bacterium]|nr:MAG: hypothetical protein EA401_07075 [Planctomycetota bacterium]
MAFAADLGSQRVNWNKAAWAVQRLPAPLSWERGSRLRIGIRTAQPRRDVGVVVAVQRQGQCWYAQSWACSLAQPVCSNEITLADLLPAEWFAPQGESHVDGVGIMDGQGITAIAVGVCNPLGIGCVSFTLTDLQLLPPPAPAATAQVRVFSQALRVEDTNAVSPGVFGSFNLPAGHVARYRLGSSRRIEHTGLRADYAPPQEGEAFVLHTLGDRVRPSPRLTHPDWRQQSAAAGRDLAQQAQEHGQHVVLEYWNEPYLNWANRNRANYIPHLYDLDAAQEGAIAHIAHDGEPVPHLRWSKTYTKPAWNWCSPRDWRRGRDAHGKLHSPVHAPPYKGMDAVYGGAWKPSQHPPEDCPDGATYTIQGDKGELALTAVTPWHLYDDSQFTHWSGSAMVPLYVQPALACAQACKDVDPLATVIIGWGNRPSEDHWAAWELLYRPTIDALIHVADGVCDHDYGGAPDKMAAVYELVDCYAMTRHGKHLSGWNSECAAATDPQAVPQAAEHDTGGADRRKCRWAMHKVIHLLAMVPDKARNCAHFGYGGSWWSDSGEGVAFDCMRALRGRMLLSQSDDDGILTVATVDGTDPRCPRPDDLGPGQDLVVAVLNRSSLPRQVQVHADAPEGCQLISGQHLACHEQNDGRMQLVVSGVAVEPHKATYAMSLEAGEVQLLRFPLQGRFAGRTGIQRRQYYAAEILTAVDAQQAYVSSVQLPITQAGKAVAARLRLAVEHLAHGAGEAWIGQQRIALPGRPDGENAARLLDVAIDPQWLSAETELRIQLSDPQCPGFRVVCASILLDSEEDLEPERQV